VYPHQTMLDDVKIDASSYAVIKVDMVHENLKDLNLEVPLDDTMLTMSDAVTRRVQWRQTFIDVDPSAAALALTTASQLNTTPALIFPEICLSPSPNQEHMHLSPI
jgi:predicted signal transduction protein with EAL and GGDEF domain